MKKVMIFICIFFFVLSIEIKSQSPGAPPPPPGEHGSSDNQPAGGGAPVGNGWILLSSLAISYGVRKYYNYKKKKLLD